MFSTFLVRGCSCVCKYGYGYGYDCLLMTYSVALIVQIYLQQNRTDLALKEVQTAKRWAQDSLLVNLAESWVGMRVVRSLPFPHGYTLRPPTPGHRANLVELYRAANTTNQPSTYTKNSPRHRVHQPHSRSWVRLLRRFIWVGCLRRRRRLIWLWRSIRTMCR